MLRVLIIGLCIFLGAVAFMYIWAPFGGRINGARRVRVLRSPNFRKRIFVNQVETSMRMHLREFLTILRDEFRTKARRRPTKQLAHQLTDTIHSDKPVATWLGHSSVLVRMNGQAILFDPILSKRASPFQWLGPKRFLASPSLTVADLPPLDAVVISHDHYDHLDYHTIRALTNQTKQFFVSLGVGAHLERWGVPAAQIVELDWWDTATLDGTTFVCTPSRHFSGRGLGDRYKTLWASWVVKTGDTAVYFSGDSGYGPHFKEIGTKYGPFDLTLMECGQYDKRWQFIHMTPEQSVKAHEDLRGVRMLPMHWGAFTLAFHAWTDSVERAVAAAAAKGLHVATPAIGQTIGIKDLADSGSAWWKQYS